VELASLAPAAVGSEGGMNGGARGILGGGVAAYPVAIAFIHWVNRRSLNDQVFAARLVVAAPS
jgi:hypothetical protein